MAENSKIEWCDHTFNPWRGCRKVSAGCKHCYAENRAGRFGEDFAKHRIRLSDAGWKEPVKWNRCYEAELASYESLCERDQRITPEPHRPRVFCASLADVFEDWTGPIVDHEGNRLATFGGGYRIAESHEPKECLATMDDLRADLFRLIDATPNLDWLLLTKRPENIRRVWPMDSPGPPPMRTPGRKRRDNVWLGTSVENQEQAEKRIPELLKCSDLCAKTFLSCEPLLGPVDLTHIDTGSKWPFKSETAKLNALVGYTASYREKLVLNGITEERGKQRYVDNANTGAIDWVIIGGESGPNARPCNIEWLRSIVSQCKEAGVACFVKQLGKSFWIPNDSVTDFNGGDRLVVDESTRMPLQGEPCLVSIAGDSKGGDITEFPTDLQIREMP